MKKTLTWSVITLTAVFAICKLMTQRTAREDSPELDRFIGSMVIFPDSIDIMSPEPATVTIYYDSAACATCQMKRAGDWKALMDELERSGRFRPVFIFSPRSSDRSQYEYELRRAGLRYTVISDYDCSFAPNNPMLPEDNRFHVFITDRNNKVVFAGNPLHNRLIFEIYQQYISALNESGGVLPEGFSDRINVFIDDRQHPENGLYLETDRIEVGDVPYGTDMTVTFTATNVTSDTITVERILTDCDCVEANASSMHINPSMKWVLNVTFAPDMQGVFSKFIFVKLKGISDEITLTVTGSCK